MNPLSLMECNVKSSMQWDWDNLISFNTSTAEVSRRLRPVDWDIDAGGGIGSDLDHPAFSKSSKSTSISSSSFEAKTYKFTSDGGGGLPDDLCSTEKFVKGIDTSPTHEVSFGSGEPVLGLKLGKRTYFEDICAGNNNPKGSGFPVSLVSSGAPMKRSKAVFQNLQMPRCQVEGCDLDLSSAKDYHRKHRVCESHSKSPKVVVGGMERRFCQQCSRFHGLSEFDEKKRSCRRRLSDHNARRRKPQPEAIQLHPGRIYDGKQQMDLVWNRFAFTHSRSEEKCLWDTQYSLKPTPLMLKPAKFDGFDGQLVFDSNRLPNSITTHHGASAFLPSNSKFARAEIPSKGIEEFTVSSNSGNTQDFHCALSLLSTTRTTTTSSWGSCDPKHVSLDHVEPPVLHHPISQPFPLGSSDYWRTEQQLVEPSTSHRDCGSQFQEIQDFRSPYENYFCSNQLD